jgi:hypothetical protein
MWYIPFLQILIAFAEFHDITNDGPAVRYFPTANPMHYFYNPLHLHAHNLCPAPSFNDK